MQVLVRRSPRAPRPADSASDSRHVAYMPALDGVRALAVLAVMAYHGGLSFLPAGFFGVDAFFVLSGFLITTLLVGEWSGAHHISLRGFWARRARRLLPALLVMVVFVVAYARFVAAPGMYPGLRGDGIAALFYSANWHFIVSGQNYFVQTGPVSPLLHTWSLAIEEQFYIVWPLLVLLLMKAHRTDSRTALRGLLGVSALGAVASAVEMAFLFNPAADPTRIYFGTDTHAQCLLVGASLAAALTLWRGDGTRTVRSDRGRAALTVVGVAGAAVCGWAWSQLHYGQTLVFRGGFMAVAISVAAVIASAVLHPAGAVARVLAWPPLRFLGRISYGMYLWHFPLDIALTAERTGLHGLALFAFRTAVTVAVSTVSFYALERPVRTGRLLPTGLARRIAPVAVLGTAGVVLLGTLAPAAGATAAPGPPAPAGNSGAPGPAVPPALAGAPVRVMVVGDSVASSLAAGLMQREDQYHIALEDLAILGCGVAEGNWVWVANQGQEAKHLDAFPCHSHKMAGYVPWTVAWANWINEVHPNVVALLAGRWEVTDRSYQGKRTDILHPGFAAYVKAMLARAVTIATSGGAHMVLLTAPCYSEGEQANGNPWPQDDPRRVAAYNELVRQVGAEFPDQVTVEDLYSMTCPGGRFVATLDGRPFRPDGVHFTWQADSGAALLAPQLLPQWERLGHEQEATGGHVVGGSLPTRLSPA